MMYRLHALLLSTTFGIVFSAQILGFLGLYVGVLPYVGAVLCAAGAWWLYHRGGNAWFTTVLAPVDEALPIPQQRAVFGLVITLLVGVFLVRMLLFPYSSLGNSISADFIGYHSLKAIELVKTGSVWDLSTPYAEYPNGYESLLAFTLPFAPDFNGVGWAQALIIGLLVAILYGLWRRYTPLSPSLVALLALGVLFVPSVYSTLFLMGKNDLFLAVYLLGALWHVPISTRRNDTAFHPIGLAMYTFLAMATKPSGITFLGVLWLIVLWQWWRTPSLMTWRTFALCVVLMFPCGFWVLRNLAMMGMIISPEVATFSSGSFLANITQPRLYANLPALLPLGALLALSVLVGVALWWRYRAWQMLLVLAVGWFGFFSVPLGAFHTPLSTTLNIEWRYGLTLWLLMGVAGVVLLERVLGRIYRLSVIVRLAPALVWVGGVGIIAILGINALFGVDEANGQQLQLPKNIVQGTGGYAHVYDYIQREVQDAVIWSSWANPLYLYGEGWTNTPREGIYPLGLSNITPPLLPDFAVISADIGMINEEARLGTRYTWETVYEDAQYTVLRRVP